MTEPELDGRNKIRWILTPEMALVLEFPTDWQLREDAGTVRTVQQATEVLAGALGTLAAKDRAYGGAWREQEIGRAHV